MALINTSQKVATTSNKIRHKTKSITLSEPLIERAEEARFVHRYASFSALVAEALEAHLKNLERNK